jgi:ubiquitin-conjugating enzyme E2 J2
MWSVSTILTGLYSFMIESKPTLGSIETSQRKKRHLASLSLKYNIEHDSTFGKLFPEYVERYELEKSQKPVDTSPTVTTGVPAHRHDVALPQGLAATVAGLVAILSIVLVCRFS